MLTRAIVEEVGGVGTPYSYKLKVRMPIINGKEGERGSTASADLSWAAILSIPSLDVQYNVGDVVIVGFEDNNLDYPIVLGHLKTPNENINRGTRVSGNMQTLNVEDRFSCPTNSIIGKTGYSEIWNATTGK